MIIGVAISNLTGTLITSSVALLSVLVTYRLGVTAHKRELATDYKAERYNEFYLPLIKFLYYQADENGLHLLALYDRQRQSIYLESFNDPKKHDTAKFKPYSDELVNFIMNNMKFASPELLRLCLDYSNVVQSVYWSTNFSLYPEYSSPDATDEVKELRKRINNDVKNKYENDTILALQRFFPLVTEILEESERLAKELQQENTSQPLRSSLKSGREFSDRLITQLQEGQEFELTLRRNLHGPLY
ncbi:hypothetical protein [Secundilactobacillus kimchicus]|uniref:hypothetical protein n=1 Tax=Secundilactobacillus kimchicus TaxID=528209 RepID=UPI0024A7AC50|nr:hypothetical protein [Secundilactobacillus kimchicus]